MRHVLPLTLLAASFAVAADWPQWRGEKRDNVWPAKDIPAKLPEKLPQIWKRPLGGGYGGIAVRGGRVYVMDRVTKPREAERVLCLDATTGKTLWEHAYDVKYGRLDYGNGPRTTPTVTDRHVYAMGALGHLHCLDAATGKVVWVRDTAKDFAGKLPTWGHACSPLLDDGRLVVQVGGKGACLVALDPATGKELWRSLDDRPGYASPVVLRKGKAARLVYFLPERVVGLDPATGKLAWEVPFEGITYDVSISDVVEGDGVLLASNYWSGSKAIRVNDSFDKPEVLWESKELNLLMATPLVKGGVAYCLDKSRGLLALEMKSGKVLWDKKHVTPRDRNPHASLVWLGDGRALALNTPGELVLLTLTPKGLEEHGRAKVVGKTWAHPGFGGGRVFARTDEEIVCVGVK